MSSNILNKFKIYPVMTPTISYTILKTMLNSAFNYLQSVVVFLT